MLLTSWYFIMYLYSIIGNLSFVLTLFGVLSVFLFGLGGFFNWMENDKFPSISRWVVPLGLVALLLAALLPSKKDILLIVAGGAVGEFVSTNKEAQALPSDVTKWLHAELQDATAELNPAIKAQKEKLENMDKEELVKQLLAAKDSLK